MMATAAAAVALLVIGARAPAPDVDATSVASAALVVPAALADLWLLVTDDGGGARRKRAVVDATVDACADLTLDVPEPPVDERVVYDVNMGVARVRGLSWPERVTVGRVVVVNGGAGSSAFRVTSVAGAPSDALWRVEGAPGDVSLLDVAESLSLSTLATPVDASRASATKRQAADDDQCPCTELFGDFTAVPPVRIIRASRTHTFRDVRGASRFELDVTANYFNVIIDYVLAVERGQWRRAQAAITAATKFSAAFRGVFDAPYTASFVAPLAAPEQDSRGGVLALLGLGRLQVYYSAEARVEVAVSGAGTLAFGGGARAEHSDVLASSDPRTNAFASDARRVGDIVDAIVVDRRAILDRPSSSAASSSSFNWSSVDDAPTCGAARVRITLAPRVVVGLSGRQERLPALAYRLTLLYEQRDDGAWSLDARVSARASVRFGGRQSRPSSHTLIDARRRLAAGSLDDLAPASAGCSVGEARCSSTVAGHVDVCERVGGCRRFVARPCADAASECRGAADVERCVGQCRDECDPRTDAPACVDRQRARACVRDADAAAVGRLCFRRRTLAVVGQCLDGSATRALPTVVEAAAAAREACGECAAEGHVERRAGGRVCDDAAAPVARVCRRGADGCLRWAPLACRAPPADDASYDACQSLAACRRCAIDDVCARVGVDGAECVGATRVAVCHASPDDGCFERRELACVDGAQCDPAAPAACAQVCRNGVHECDALDARRCVDGGVLRCVVDAAGCLRWRRDADASAASCRLGERRCASQRAGAFERCELDDDGCTRWSTPVACANGVASCAADALACVGCASRRPCAPSEAGAIRCAPDSRQFYEVCGETFDGSACFEWRRFLCDFAHECRVDDAQSLAPCAHQCGASTCRVGARRCVDGGGLLSSGTWSVCERDARGCARWSAPRACQGEHICSERFGWLARRCFACADDDGVAECTDVGQLRCAASGDYERCEVAEDGCRRWRAYACQRVGDRCSPSTLFACVTGSPCPASPIACRADGERVCTSRGHYVECRRDAASGCFTTSAVERCPSSGACNCRQE